jgi:threonine synthase
LSSADFDPELIDTKDASLWRYLRLFDLDLQSEPTRLNAGWTPLLPGVVRDCRVFLKVEYIAPTGSFKDRGTELMVNLLASQGVRRVTDDSSGNAGASVAAYAARLGMESAIYVPAHASPAKQAQIACYGASVLAVPGPRQRAKEAALNAVDNGWIPAFHAYHPAFLLGQETVAWEIWEQLGRHVPDWYVVPVGQGVHLLGAWLGWKRLQEAGRIGRLPRLAAIQAAAVAPVCRAYAKGSRSVAPVEPLGTSVAEGLAIAAPVRGDRLLEALRDTNGICVQVDDREILAAQTDLAHQGFYVEPTSASAVAAIDSVRRIAGESAVVIVALTGSGLKGSPKP